MAVAAAGLGGRAAAVRGRGAGSPWSGLRGGWGPTRQSGEAHTHAHTHARGVRALCWPVPAEKPRIEWAWRLNLPRSPLGRWLLRVGVDAAGGGAVGKLALPLPVRSVCSVDR